MPLLFTPPCMALLGATVLFLGMGEDSPSWMSAGAGFMLVAAGAALVGASRSRWIHRLRSDSWRVALAGACASLVFLPIGGCTA